MADEIPSSKNLREIFIETLGYWDPTYVQVLEASPIWFAAWTDFAAVPWRTGVLPAKVKEFIHITLNASTTHLHEPALRQHIANALRHGATAAEIIEVFQIISILGVHSMMLSVPILREEAETRGLAVGDGELTAHQSAIKESYVASRGYWPPSWDSILTLAPDFVQAHERLGAVPFEQGVLEPKVREFILIAVDASTTHLFPIGVRTHMRSALEHGASVAEIVEVLALTCVVGTQSVTFGVPILMEELAKFNRGAGDAETGTDARSL